MLDSVSDASTQFALAGSVGTLPGDTVTMAEIGAGLHDDLHFAGEASTQPMALIARDADLFRDGVARAADTLFVQHAVRHEALADAQALFVQGAVRQSQHEAQLRALRAAGQNSAAAGAATLFDPFALSAPIAPVRSPVEAPTAKPAKRAEAAEVGDGRTSIAASEIVPIDALVFSPAPARDARGFSMQLRQSAARLHVRPAVPDRTPAFVVPRDKGLVASRIPTTGEPPATR